MCEKIATKMHDSVILVKFRQGDVIVIEACYHAKCLNSYYNRSLAKQREDKCNSDAVCYGVVLIDIVAHIEAKTTAVKQADLIKNILLSHGRTRS